MSTYAELEQEFAEQRKGFKSFEDEYLAGTAPKHAKELDARIVGFTHWLEVFSSLHYQMLLVGSLQQQANANFKKDIDGLTIIINKIQFIYVTQLTQKLNTANNKDNLLIARIAILLGLVCTVFSLIYAHYDSKDSQDQTIQMLNTIENRANAIAKKDSLLERKIKKDTVYLLKKTYLAVRKKLPPQS